MRLPLGGLTRVVLTAAAGCGLVVAATAHPVSVDAAGRGGTPAGDPARAVVGDVTLQCPGMELTGIPGVKDEATPGRVLVASAPADVLGAAPSGPGDVTLRGAGAAERLGLSGRGSSSGAALPRGSGVDVRATGSLAPGLAAAQEWRADTATLRGLTTTACAQPASELWLAAGGSDPGRQEHLVLTNPGANEVSADVEVRGVKGIVRSPSSSAVTVPGHGRAVVLLDALAPGERSPVAHVTVTGGAVAASLTDSWLDGLRPLGAETTAAMAAPATRQVVPVVRLGGAGTAFVRVAAVGAQDAVVSLRLLAPDGGHPLPGGSVVTVPGGSVADLPVRGAAPGRYAVEVRADVPVVAAGMVSVRDPRRGDIAWSPATTPLGTLAGLPLPAGRAGRAGRAGDTGDTGDTAAPMTRTLTLSAGGGPVQVRVVRERSGDDATWSVTIPSDSIRTLDLGSGAGAVWVRRLEGTGRLRAAVDSASGTGTTRMVSVTPLQPSQVTSLVRTAVAVP